MASSLKEQLQNDLKTAMREKDLARRDTDRLLISEVKRREIELQRDLDQEEEVKLLQREVKQRTDAIEQFRSGGRDDLIAKEEGQLEMIQSYLPQQMEDEELNRFVADAIATTGSNDPKDIGKLMGMLSKSAAGRVDSGRLSEEIRHQLSHIARER